MTEILEHITKMDTQGILALCILVVVAAGYKTLDWWIKSKLEASKETARTERREQRNRELAESLAGVVGEQRRLHAESQEQLLVMFREDRAALAASLLETIESVDCFTADDRDKLTRTHNAHLGAGARRPDGTLRWHQSDQAEVATIETRDNVRKLVDLAAEQREQVKETNRMLARLEARA